MFSDALRIVLIVTTVVGYAQSPEPSTFEVAAIKPADPDDRNQGFRLNGRRISIEDSTMTGPTRCALDRQTRHQDCLPLFRSNWV